MQEKDKKIWQHVFRKVKGAFGDTDYDKKVIRVDKGKHKKKSLYGVPKKDSSMINTMVHEEMHKNHPKMTEKAVRKNTRKKVKKMSKKLKAKIYSKYK